MNIKITELEITELELREVYGLLTKEQLIDVLIKKHKEYRDLLRADHVCSYSKSMNQTFPRKCIHCGKPEFSKIP